MKTKTIYSKGGEYNALSELILKQDHVLIGGTTGGGKSVLLNAILTDGLCFNKLYYLIDPKGIELSCYKNTPNCRRYCGDYRNVLQVVKEVHQLMETRFKTLVNENMRKHNGLDVYLVFDEYADIKFGLPKAQAKEVENLVFRIISKGRAAKVHVILCTQRCTNDVLSNKIKSCMTCKVGLRTASAQESRNVIGQSGCELLPRYGYCYLRYPDSTTLQLTEINMYKDEEIEERIKNHIEYNKEKNKQNSFWGRLFNGN